ncbi:FAD-dependent monooxygenase [Streptomyces sp. NPDC002082]|uniref:FAD-dependent monooxygenase n=1 Tax=Streptomyces sp. NPDC002082 TaxID=3154772 RepID=UPI003316AC1A
MRVRAAVIGGGVAGTASAIALRRRTGAEVTVYEAYDTAAGEEAGRVGSFLSLAVNGLRALDRIGVLAPVRAAGFAFADQCMWSASGRLLGRVPRGRLASDTLHSTTLLRERLVGVMRAEAERAGVRIVTGRRVQADSLDADLVVAADGLWSATRTALDPGAPRPEYAGLYSISGISRDVPLPGDAFHMVLSRKGAFLCLPVADGGVWWSAQVASPRPPDLAHPPQEWLPLLRELYAGSRTPAAVLAGAVESDRPTLMHELAEVPVWHDARTVLIGDAAHPVGAGQGASMALEDAVALADAVAAAPSVAGALTAYDRLRRPRVARMTKAAAGNREAKTPGRVQHRATQALMPLFLRYAYPRATAWLYEPTA